MTSSAPEPPAPLALLDQVAEASARLVRTVEGMGDDDVREPSLLPGWTRGHVLAHISRNADSLVNLLLWARTGIETPQYASPFIRDYDIEAGSSRPLAEQLIDLEASAARFAALASTAPDTAWAATVRTRGGREIRATEIPWMRLQEVEIHHADLAAGYGPADWPEEFLTRLLPAVTADLSAAAAAHVPPLTPAFAVEATDTRFAATIGTGVPTRTIAGPGHALVAWLIGRSTGDALPASLPELPAWR
ncbi:maleylpyruvate isomerase family mycothiol-dependent enzyme [Nocardia sp. NPDC005366]|uniref:maleylpyruvate isomerase family mycothiol-dependent enzyme n=1 Tax=Nocardia sp. NPDC005366 TaxID=3156878 RepID=UPI00339F82F8